MKRISRSFRTLCIERLEVRVALDGSPLLKGDFNRDGRLTVADLPAMVSAFADLKHYQVTQALTDAQLLEIADADGSGMTSNADFQAVINLIASAGTASPPPTTWFDSNVQDAGIRTIGDQEFADGLMDRNDMINLLRAVEQSGPVTSAQMSDLTLIVNTASLFGSLDYVQQLAKDVVLGNGYGNASYQGTALGNLAVGSSADQLEKLVDKWFLGLDHPTATSAYQLATQPLFASGFAYTDIHQGGIGDCYLLAGLAEVALKHPEIINSMFIDNGDGTYTVRYYIDAQPYNTAYQPPPTYITVDSMLPSGVADHSTELWVALAEKGYVQLKTLSGYANAYAVIEGGFPAPAINQLTGRAIISSTLDLSLFTTDLSTGKMTCFAIGTHAYAVVNYDSASQVVTLYDPYGSLTTITWSQLVSDGDVLQCVL